MYEDPTPTTLIPLARRTARHRAPGVPQDLLGRVVLPSTAGEPLRSGWMTFDNLPEFQAYMVALAAHVPTAKGEAITATADPHTTYAQITRHG